METQHFVVLEMEDISQRMKQSGSEDAPIHLSFLSGKIETIDRVPFCKNHRLDVHFQEEYTAPCFWSRNVGSALCS